MSYDPTNPLIVQGDRTVLLDKHGEHLRLVCPDRPLLEELARQPKLREYLGDRLDEQSFVVETGFRGVIKQVLIGLGYPAEDLAGYTEGADLALQLRELA